MRASTCFYLTAPNTPIQPNGSIQILIFLLLFAGMWFLMIAPQRKRQKQHNKMVQELKSGDEIMTNAGIFGTITATKPDRFIVKIADNVKIEIHKSSIQHKLQKVQE